MPARPESFGITDTYRAHLLTLRQRTVQAVVALWASVRLEDLDATYRQWQQAAAQLTAGARMNGMALTAGYVAAYIASEAGRPVAVPTVPLDAATVALDGRPLAAVLAPPMLTVRMALGSGLGVEEAFRLGVNRAARTVAREVMAAPRDAAKTAFAHEPLVEGWRRVASPTGCGACLAAMDGAVRAPDEAPEHHDGCRCTAEPVIAGVHEAVRRPTGEEYFNSLPTPQQDALFYGRGGEAKAALLRAGLPFESLMGHSQQVAHPDQLVERPLHELEADAGLTGGP